MERPPAAAPAPDAELLELLAAALTATREAHAAAAQVLSREHAGLRVAALPPTTATGPT
jgi:hypothetical protein